MSIHSARHRDYVDAGNRFAEQDAVRGRAHQGIAIRQQLGVPAKITRARSRYWRGKTRWTRHYSRQLPGREVAILQGRDRVRCAERKSTRCAAACERKLIYHLGV